MMVKIFNIPVHSSHIQRVLPYQLSQLFVLQCGIYCKSLNFPLHWMRVSERTTMVWVQGWRNIGDKSLILLIYPKGQKKWCYDWEWWVWLANISENIGHQIQHRFIPITLSAVRTFSNVSCQSVRMKTRTEGQVITSKYTFILPFSKNVYVNLNLHSC